MKNPYLKLHISILLAGFTGILGKLITLNEGFLVWYRMLITVILLILILFFTKRLKIIPLRAVIRIGLVGLLLALHWVFFYGSIKASNVSIGVICFSLTSFFTSLFEPIINQRKISLKELFFSLISVLGILLIFGIDTQYQLGISLGFISSILCALFVIYNKKIGAEFTSSTMLMYEMLGGFIGLTILLPFYTYCITSLVFYPNAMDWVYLFVLSLFCTIGMCILQIQALRKISAFTVNLSYNLEPIYSIILAMIIFHEGKEFTLIFYIGLILIFVSVFLQMIDLRRESRKKIKSV